MPVELECKLVLSPSVLDSLDAVDSVNAAGVAYYSAAGNSGRASYEGDFNDSNVIFCIEFYEAPPLQRDKDLDQQARFAWQGNVITAHD